MILKQLSQKKDSYSKQTWLLILKIIIEPFTLLFYRFSVLDTNLRNYFFRVSF